MNAKLLLFAAVFFSKAANAEEWVSLEKADGAALFGEKCGMCHRATGMGTGILARRMSAELALLENRTDLQAEFVRTAVRKGFGVMFPISRGEVSDPQLDTLVAYLVKDGSAEVSGVNPLEVDANTESAPAEASEADVENAQ